LTHYLQGWLLLSQEPKSNSKRMNAKRSKRGLKRENDVTSTPKKASAYLPKANSRRREAVLAATPTIGRATQRLQKLGCT